MRKIRRISWKLLFFIGCITLVACSNQQRSVERVRFSVLNTGTDASLRGLFVVDENVVWASGSGGVVLLSANSGTNWKDVSIPGTGQNDFRSIHAWDEKKAIVFGVAGPDFGYKTIDGGTTWKVVFRDTTSGLFFNSVKLADAKNGLAVSDPIDGKFFVLRTEDAGNTWEKVENLPPVEEGEANFAASNTCIEYLPSGKAWIASGGKAARVFYSADFGKSWKVSKTPMVRGLSSSGIFSVAFKNDMEGIIVGGIYDQPELNTNIASYTVNGGVTWLPAVTMPKEYRSCVQQVKTGSGSFIFAIGKTGCDISTDGGMNWTFLSGEGYFTFRAVPGKLSGFAAASGGKIAKVEFE